jgi:hypothetical protein
MSPTALQQQWARSTARRDTPGGIWLWLMTTDREERTMSTEGHVSIILTEEEMAELDDGQEWYKPGDTVYLAGYLPEHDDDNPGLDLSVNGVGHDSWMFWADLPEPIRQRLAASAKQA